MEFKITISPLADVDVADAYQYYADVSLKVLKDFDIEIEASYKALEQNPFFKVRYKNVRGLPLKNFPFIIFYTLDEVNQTVEIRSVFNTHQDPAKYR
jgi:plasmid stabilization system protein ParE